MALEAHCDRPELEALRRETFRALEIRDEAEIMRGMTQGELEAQVLVGERAIANAPLDVSTQLRDIAQAQADSRLRPTSPETGPKPKAPGSWPGS